MPFECLFCHVRCQTQSVTSGHSAHWILCARKMAKSGFTWLIKHECTLQQILCVSMYRLIIIIVFTCQCYRCYFVLQFYYWKIMCRFSDFHRNCAIWINTIIVNTTTIIVNTTTKFVGTISTGTMGLTNEFLLPMLKPVNASVRLELYSFIKYWQYRVIFIQKYCFILKILTTFYYPTNLRNQARFDECQKVKGQYTHLVGL